ncbi:MAG: hypothetical protein ACK55I_29625, partial [bacterium]
VAGVADQFGPLPVLAQGAVDVGRVEQHEPRRLVAARVLAPDEPVVVHDRERILLARPRHRREAGKELAQIDPAGQPLRQAGHRVPGAGGLRQRTADRRADERVGDQALTGVRAAADRRHEERLPRHLGPQLAEQRALPLGLVGRRCPDGTGRGLER